MIETSQGQNMEHATNTSTEIPIPAPRLKQHIEGTNVLPAKHKTSWRVPRTLWSRHEPVPRQWVSWGKQATTERPQNSDQSPVPKIRVSNTQVTKQSQTKPTGKRIPATWVDDEPHGHSPPTCPGPKSLSPPTRTLSTWGPGDAHSRPRRIQT